MGSTGGPKDVHTRSHFLAAPQKNREAMPVLEFSDIRYEASGLDILKGVSGYAQSGKLLAIMGSSGAGKVLRACIRDAGMHGY